METTLLLFYKMHFSKVVIFCLIDLPRSNKRVMEELTNRQELNVLIFFSSGIVYPCTFLIVLHKIVSSVIMYDKQNGWKRVLIECVTKNYLEFHVSPAPLLR
jgi:hypothetical protein